MTGRTLLLPIDALRPHESIDGEILSLVREELARGHAPPSDPIWVDNRTGIILDGHHRARAASDLGWHEIRCWVVDYRRPEIRVFARRSGYAVSKSEVIRRAMAFDLYPPKTTRHVLVGNAHNERAHRA